MGSGVVVLLPDEDHIGLGCSGGKRLDVAEALVVGVVDPVGCVGHRDGIGHGRRSEDKEEGQHGVNNSQLPEPAAGASVGRSGEASAPRSPKLRDW